MNSISSLPPAATSGPLMAHLLRGCWRTDAPPVEIDAASLDEILPALIDSGVGALAWRRLRHSALTTTQAVQTLQEVRFKQALAATVQARSIARTFDLLAPHGIEPLLVKGWATARTYPEAGMRPSGDIDLLIRPDQKRLAEQVLGIAVDDGSNALWDIKTQVPAIYQVSAEALFARRQRVMLGQTAIWTLGAEDQLRVLCLHFFKHGAWRPLWACDIAAALEFRPADFDWSVCLGEDAQSADQIACALGVVHQLLGAEISCIPVEKRATELPKWLTPAVLKAWQRPQISQHRAAPFFMETLRQRRGVMRALFRRWPNPIEAAMEYQTPLEKSPLPAQIALFQVIVRSFVKRKGNVARD